MADKARNRVNLGKAFHNGPGIAPQPAIAGRGLWNKVLDDMSRLFGRKEKIH
jgi:hypothetical protein